jgi:hypothetical protein
MSKYPETPDWWFWTVLLISFVMAIIIVTVYPVSTPVWTLFFAFGMDFVSLIPMVLLYSTTGVLAGTDEFIGIILGYALPGNPNAINIVKAYSYTISEQADSYISDQKMGHYAKIPPVRCSEGK